MIQSRYRLSGASDRLAVDWFQGAKLVFRAVDDTCGKAADDTGHRCGARGAGRGLERESAVVEERSARHDSGPAPLAVFLKPVY
jgi:hypothetical protein